MGVIKSALEIAMERTENVKSDKETIKKQEFSERGKKIASDFLHGDARDFKAFKKAVSEFKGHEKELILKGMADVFLSNLTLPKNGVFDERMERIKEGLGYISTDEKKVSAVIDQIKQFFQQYNQHVEQITEQLKQHFAPRLKEKQQELAKQFGQEVELSPEQDPEFVNSLQSNMQQLDEQYRKALTEVKKEISSLLP